MLGERWWGSTMPGRVSTMPGRVSTMLEGLHSTHWQSHPPRKMASTASVGGERRGAGERQS